MKLTKQQLAQIIKEEVKSVITEAYERRVFPAIRDYLEARDRDAPDTELRALVQKSPRQFQNFFSEIQKYL